MMGQQPENIPCDEGGEFHCESTCQLTLAELAMVHSTYSTSVIYLLASSRNFQISTSVSLSALSPCIPLFYPQSSPGLLPRIVNLYPEKQRNVSLAKETPLLCPCWFSPSFILLAFMKGEKGLKVVLLKHVYLCTWA